MFYLSGSGHSNKLNHANGGNKVGEWAKVLGVLRNVWKEYVIWDGKNGYA